jgi:hypothetical protein
MIPSQDVKMKKGKNVSTVFEQISSLGNKYNTASNKIVNQDLIAVVLDVARVKHQAVLADP